MKPKQRKNKLIKSRALHLVNSSLVAMSITSTGLAYEPSKAAAESSVNASAVVQQSEVKPPVYQGDSLQYFANMLNIQQNAIQLQTGENTAPVVTPKQFSIRTNNALTEAFAASDNEQTELSFRIVQQPSSGTVNVHVENGSFTYTPEHDFVGEDTFTFVANDGYADSEEATVTIKVTKPKDHKDNTKTSSTAAPSAPGSTEDGTSSIDSGKNLIPAKNNGAQTPNAASMGVSQSSNGKRIATVTLIADGVREAISQAKEMDTITIPLSDSADLDDVQAEIPNDAVQALTSKATVLSLQAGQLEYKLPTASLPWTSLAGELGLSKNQISLQLEMKKADTLPPLTDASGHSKAISDAYTVKMTAQAGDREVIIPGLENRFAKLTIPLSETLTDYSKAYAVLIEDGKEYPVPMYIDHTGAAIINTSRNGTFLIKEREESFTDSQDHWASEAIQTLANKMVIQGAEGKFDPDREISRAEFASMMARALGLDGAVSAASAKAFTDIPQDSWYASAVEATVQAGIFKGVAEDQFAPEQTITREQMAAVIVRAIHAFHLQLLDASGDGSSTVQLNDLLDVSDWAKEEVSEAIRSGLIHGFSDGTIASMDPGTRSQSAVLLLQLLQRSGLLN